MEGFWGWLHARPRMIRAAAVVLVGAVLAVVVATSGRGSSGQPLKTSAAAVPTTGADAVDDSSTTTTVASLAGVDTSTTARTGATTVARSTTKTTTRAASKSAGPTGTVPGQIESASTQPPPGQPPAPPFANVCPSAPVDVPTSAGMYIVGLDGSERHYLPQHNIQSQASVAPDGSVAVVGDSTGRMLVDLSNGNVLNTTVLGGVWSHDGQRLATTLYGDGYSAPTHGVVITDRSGTVLKNFGNIGRQAPTTLAWSPDDSTIAETSGAINNEPAETAGIVLIDVASGTWRNLTHAYFGSLSWSADGTKLLGARSADQVNQGDVEIVSVSDGSMTRVRSGGSFAGYTDHNTVAVAGDKYGLYDVPVGGGAEREITNSQVISWRDIVSPDGKYVMVRVWPDGAHPNPGLYLVDTNPGGCARLMMKTGSASFIWGGWLPGGRGFIIYPYSN